MRKSRKSGTREMTRQTQTCQKGLSHSAFLIKSLPTCKSYHSQLLYARSTVRCAARKGGRQRKEDGEGLNEPFVRRLLLTITDDGIQTVLCGCRHIWRGFKTISPPLHCSPQYHLVTTQIQRVISQKDLCVSLLPVCVHECVWVRACMRACVCVWVSE